MAAAAASQVRHCRRWMRCSLLRRTTAFQSLLAGAAAAAAAVMISCSGSRQPSLGGAQWSNNYAVPPWRATADAASPQLHHTQLQELAAVGVLSYDGESAGMRQREGRPTLVRQLADQKQAATKQLLSTLKDVHAAAHSGQIPKLKVVSIKRDLVRLIMQIMPPLPPSRPCAGAAARGGCCVFHCGSTHSSARCHWDSRHSSGCGSRRHWGRQQHQLVAPLLPGRPLPRQAQALLPTRQSELLQPGCAAGPAARNTFAGGAASQPAAVAAQLWRCGGKGAS